MLIIALVFSWLSILTKASTFEAMPTSTLGADYDIDLTDINSSALTNGLDVSIKMLS